MVRLNADGTSKVIEFPTEVLTLKSDRDGGIWIGLSKRGICYIPDIGKPEDRISGLGGFSVTGFCHDREGGTWCSTLEHGVYYCLNKSIRSYASIDGLHRKCSLLDVQNGILHCSSAAGKLFLFRKNALSPETVLLPFSGHLHLKSLIYRGPDVFVSDVFQTSVFTGNFRLRTDIPKHLRQQGGTFYAVDELDGNCYAAAYRDVVMIRKGSFLKERFMPVSAGALKLVLVIDGKEMLLAGKSFLLSVNMSDRSVFLVRGIKSEVTSLLKSRSGEIYLTTRDQGIFRYERKTKTVAPLDAKLPTDVLYKVREDQNGRLWIASNRGIIRLTKKGEAFSTASFTTRHGLLSNSVSDIAVNGSTVYFTSYEGLFSFGTDADFTAHSNQSVYLNRIFVNNRPFSIQNNRLDLNYRQKNIRLDFDIPSFRTGNSVYYELTGGPSGSGGKLGGNELVLSGLSPGTYRLGVRITGNDDPENSYPWLLYITIRPPFWETGWFYFSSALGFLAITFLFSFLIVKRIKKREQLRTQTSTMLAEYQMSALQAQMNPHFIFNAINTIQGYILSQNKDEAYNYLVHFSKLIRMVLHHSQQKNVPLDEELEMLRLYVGLEQLRFDQCFDFIVETGPEVETHDLFIPSMIIQPFIENSIWHGIINLKRSRHGILRLSISLQDEKLFIVIEDNGVGREQAANYKTSRHKSAALSVTRRRLAMLNRKFGTGFSGLEIIDLYNDAGESAGTRVEIRIPAQFSDH